MPAIPTGSPAPDFELMTDRSRVFRLSDNRGHPVVLFFYPQDDTEGCTLENIEFTALIPQFEGLGVRVLGVSPDSVSAHCAFREKYALGAVLASDPDHRVIEAYGLWQLKKMFGVEFMGVRRATVLIDPDGRVSEVIHATRIKGHAQKVLDAARALLKRPA